MKELGSQLKMSFHALCVAVFALIVFGVLTQGYVPKGDKPGTRPVVAPTGIPESPETLDALRHSPGLPK